MDISPKMPNPYRITIRCVDCKREVGATVTVIDPGIRYQTRTKVDEEGWWFSDIYGWICPEDKEKRGAKGKLKDDEL
jgi:hypothetical protein